MNTGAITQISAICKYETHLNDAAPAFARSWYDAVSPCTLAKSAYSSTTISTPR